MSGPRAGALGAGNGGPAGIRLRPVTPADVPLFFEYQRDPQAARMAGATPAARGDHDRLWLAIRTDPAIPARAIVVDGAIAG
jgi:hypothetical protein